SIGTTARTARYRAFTRTSYCFDFRHPFDISDPAERNVEILLSLRHAEVTRFPAKRRRKCQNTLGRPLMKIGAWEVLAPYTAIALPRNCDRAATCPTATRPAESTVDASGSRRSASSTRSNAGR